MSYEAPITKSDGWFIGEDKLLSFTIVDQTLPAHPVVDITDWTIEFRLSDLYSGDDVILIPADLAADPSTGKCTVTIPSDETIGLEGDLDYWYVLRRTDTGQKEELSFGKAYLRDVWVNYS